MSDPNLRDIFPLRLVTCSCIKLKHVAMRAIPMSKYKAAPNKAICSPVALFGVVAGVKSPKPIVVKEEKQK